MQTNTPANLRRWERQPATIPINLVLKAEDFKVDNSATIIDFSLRGVGVLTTLALVPGERVRIVAKGEFRDAIPARVVWVREDGSNHLTFAGLEFLDISEA
jgi:c-di-GMP-binding flagellar brake protein YcgR